MSQGPDQRLSPKPLVVCGLGPHARRIHYPLIEKYHRSHGVEVALLVELEDQRAVVEEYLADRYLQPKRIVYLPEPERKGHRLNVAFEAAAAEALADEGLWGIVISSEPKSHFIYAQWAIAHGLHTLLDKPITANDLLYADPAEALTLVEEFYELLEGSRRAATNILVQVQRRAHAGYQALHSYLNDVVEEFGVPITYTDIYHSDGMWNMPDEFLSRENHPYRYGYGKLMHSGYHFLDLFSWITALNDKLPECAPETIELVTRHITPADSLRQIPLRVYDSFFQNGALLSALVDDPSGMMRHFGETDVFLLTQMKRDDAVISTGAISLLQTSFSRRAWPNLPKDTYKGNGRVRHERVTVQIGPLLNVQIHSYQSYEAKERRTSEMGFGGYDHFDILFFRNSALIGGAPFEEIKLGDKLREQREGQDYLGHNELAREEIFLDFLEEKTHRAGIALHERAVKLLAASYYSLLATNQGLLVNPKLNLASGSEDWLTDLAVARRR